MHDPTSPEGSSTERQSGLSFETCYRHPDQVTGVHCTRCNRPICTDCMRPAAVGYQCPECVKEAQHTGPRRPVSLTLGRSGGLTRVLILACVGMFVVEFATGASSLFSFNGDLQKMYNLGASNAGAISGVAHIVDYRCLPGSFTPQYWRLFTNMFLHWGAIHLLLNMYALYLFGPLIEEAYGSGRFLALYVTTGLLASTASYAFGPAFNFAAGASGAIFGLLGVWFAYNYRRREMRFHRANLQGAITLIALNLIIGFSFSGIDWRAHVGGLISGAVLGYTAEGIGEDTTRRLVRVGGFVVMLGLGAALLLFRTHQMMTSVSINAICPGG
jgi:membrane associated rhomboid family serine protease